MEERCSFDARNRGSTRLPLKVKWGIGKSAQLETNRPTFGSRGGATHYSCEWSGGVNRASVAVVFADHFRVGSAAS